VKFAYTCRVIATKWQWQSEWLRGGRRSRWEGSNWDTCLWLQPVKQTTRDKASLETKPHSFAKLMAFHLGASFMQGCRHRPTHSGPSSFYVLRPFVVGMSACARQIYVSGGRLRRTANLHASGIRNEAGLCRAVGVECHAYFQTASWRLAMTLQHQEQELKLTLKLQRFKLVAYALVSQDCG